MTDLSRACKDNGSIRVRFSVAGPLPFILVLINVDHRK